MVATGKVGTIVDQSLESELNLGVLNIDGLDATSAAVQFNTATDIYSFYKAQDIATGNYEHAAVAIKAVRTYEDKENGVNYFEFKSPVNITSSYSITWPSAAPANNQTLVADATGQFSWKGFAFIAAGSGVTPYSPVMFDALGGLADIGAMNNGQILIGRTGLAPAPASLTGTTDQVNITNGSGSIALSLPQNIAAASSPTFAGLTLSGFSGVVKSSAGVLSASTIVNADVSASAAIALSKLAATTVSRALVSDGTGLITPSSTTATEIGYVSGVTSAIQGQFTTAASNLTAHTGAASGAHAAAAISNTPTGNLAAATVQAALDELQTDVDTRATSASLTAHTGAATGAHAASAIANTASGNLAATNVQAALNELQGDIDTRATSTGASLTGATIADSLKFTEGADPATPSAGTLSLYAKIDKKIYTKNSDGTVTEVGSGSGGAKNYVPSNYRNAEGGLVASWVASSANIAVTTTTTAGEVLAGTKSYKVTTTASATTSDYVELTLDAVDLADRAQALLITNTFKMLHASATSGDLKLVIMDGVTEIVPSVTDIAAGLVKYQALFAATTSSTYKLRLKNGIAGATRTISVAFDESYVGSRELVYVPAVTDWVSYTPTFTGIGAATGSDFWWRRVGDSAEVKGTVVAGTVTASSFRASLPTGLSFDTAKQVNSRQRAGDASVTGGSIYGVALDSTETTNLFLCSTNIAVNTLGTDIGSTNRIALNALVPIANWTSNFQTGNTTVEFAYNSSTSATTESTLFGYGQEGVVFKSFAPTGVTSVNKRVRFQTPIQASDVIILEILQPGTTIWQPTSTRYFCLSTNDAKTTNFGMAWVPVNSTDIDVQFYSTLSDGTAWSAIADSYKWRVRKSSGVSPTVIDATKIIGRTDGQAPAAGMIGETLTATISSQAMTPGPNFNAATLTLPAGRWRVKFKALVQITTVVSTFSNADSWISTVSLSSHTASTVRDLSTATAADRYMPWTERIIDVTTSQVVYGCVYAGYSGGAVQIHGAGSQFYAERIA